MEERTKITHVAILFQDKVYSLPPPNRHHDVIRLIVEETGVNQVHGEEQGFLDESGRFLRRKAALVSALLHDQVKDPDKIRCGMLFSEDLW